MQEAARLLLNTDLPIHVITSSIGYENRTVFYQHFQEKYHMTPSQYRESLCPLRNMDTSPFGASSTTSLIVLQQFVWKFTN